MVLAILCVARKHALVLCRRQRAPTETLIRLIKVLCKVILQVAAAATILKRFIHAISSVVETKGQRKGCSMYSASTWAHTTTRTSTTAACCCGCRQKTALTRPCGSICLNKACAIKYLNNFSGGDTPLSPSPTARDDETPSSTFVMENIEVQPRRGCRGVRPEQ